MQKLVVLITGGTLLLVGIAMVILPGPAIVVIPVALAILATEFSFARRWLAISRRRLSATASARRGQAADRHRYRL